MFLADLPLSASDLLLSLCRIFDKDLREGSDFQGNILSTLARQKASAWYYVTYKESWDNVTPRNLFSFAWIAESFLINIKRQAMAAQDQATSV